MYTLIVCVYVGVYHCMVCKVMIVYTTGRWMSLLCTRKVSLQYSVFIKSDVLIGCCIAMCCTYIMTCKLTSM